MKKYKLYLFDFDGTLIDSMGALDYVFRVSFEHVGLKYDSKDVKEFSRIPLTESYKKLNGKEEDWAEFCAYIDKSLDFPKALEENSPYEETMEFISYLRKNHILAGIVTSNNSCHVKQVLEKMNIPEDTFSLILGNKEYKKFKPHPEPIFEALKSFNNEIDTKDVVYIGDGMNDTLCANAAGVDAILIDRDNVFPESDKYIRIRNLMELF